MGSRQRKISQVLTPRMTRLITVIRMITATTKRITLSATVLHCSATWPVMLSALGLFGSSIQKTRVPSPWRTSSSLVIKSITLYDSSLRFVLCSFCPLFVLCYPSTVNSFTLRLSSREGSPHQTCDRCWSIGHRCLLTRKRRGKSNGVKWNLLIW